MLLSTLQFVLLFGLALEISIGISIENEADVCQCWNECKNPKNKVFDSPFSRPCYCEDENCWFYNDCCKDTKVTERDFVESIKPECKSIPSLRKRYYVVNSCPETLLDENLVSLCTKDVDEYHYTFDLPFVSNETKILYENMYCAMCNDDYSSGNALEVELKCPTPNCSAEILDEFNYESGNLLWATPNGDVTIEITIQNGSGLRECFPLREVIDECADDWDDESVSSKCRDYTNYVETTKINKIYYKNIHCAICNHENMSEIICIGGISPPFFIDSSEFAGNSTGNSSKIMLCLKHSSFQRKMSPFIPNFSPKVSYSALLDFTTKKDCPSDRIKHKSGICIPFLCGKNFKRENGLCVVDESQNTTYNSSMDCPVILIPIEDLTFVPNGIYVNSSNTFHETNEFEQINETSYHVCAPIEETDLSDTIERILSTICILISLISLATHVTIHCVIGNYVKLPDKNLLNLSCALFFAQFVYFFGNNVFLHKTICYACAVLSHYCFLVVFFWMNVMAFDVCLTITKSEQRGNSKKTFIYYFIYSWVLPLIIVVFAVCIDHVDVLPDVKPLYGVEMCWINDRNALIVFFVIPLTILLLENILFYSLTAYGIHKTMKLTRHVTKSSESKRFHLYVKLAFIMGGTWILGFIPNLTDFKGFKYVNTVLNASQGTFVFVIFTLKSRILMKFRNKLSGKKITSTTTRSTVSTDAFSSTKTTN